MTAPDAPLPAPTPEDREAMAEFLGEYDRGFRAGFRAGIESAAKTAARTDLGCDEYGTRRQCHAAIARAIRALSPDAADHGDGK